MDTQILFTMNQALEAWRAGLPAMSPDDRTELEGHLLDSMSELRTAGLTEEEAFWLARRRLGEAVDSWGMSAGVAGGASEDDGRSGRSRRGWLVAGGLLCLAAVAAGIYPRLVKPRYESHVVMELHRSPRIVGREWVPKPGVEGTPQGMAQDFISTQMNIVQSKETRRQMIEKMGLPARWEMDEEGCDRRLAGLIRAEALPGGEMMRLVVRSTDPAEAVDLANGLTDAYIDRRREDETDRVQLLFQTLSHLRKSQESEVNRAQKAWKEAAQAIGVTPTAQTANQEESEAGSLPAEVDSELAANYRQSEAHALRSTKTLRQIEDDMESARLAGLHPLKPITLHEKATPAARPSWPDYRFWNTVAGASALLGACLVGVGMRRKR